jgi:hypothetical protein
VRNGVGVRLDPFQEAALLEQGDDALARLEAVEAVERHHLRRGLRPGQKLGIAFELEPSLRPKDVDGLEIVPPADLEVVEVVRGGDLDRAGALLRIGILVGDDRDAAIHERQDRVAPDEIAVALVVRVHGDA